MCQCGTCRRCRQREASRAYRRLNAPLEQCPVWQRHAKAYDTRFPVHMLTTADLWARAERGITRHTLPRRTN
jgi:hypothetical protein